MARSPRPPKRQQAGDAGDTRFDLERSVIALPLLRAMKDKRASQAQHIIIDLNLDYPGGRDAARDKVFEVWRSVTKGARNDQLAGVKNSYSRQYVFGRLSAEKIRELVAKDRAAAPYSIFRVWLDHKVETFVNKSISTVKADAAAKAFGAHGEDIVWAVADTGVDSAHPHFELRKNLEIDLPLHHCDFTAEGKLDDTELSRRACHDGAGHGTHVAGIIAGEFIADDDRKIHATVERRNESGAVEGGKSSEKIEAISGMAPRCKILSLKVLDDAGEGRASNLIAALEFVQSLNSFGRRILVHGVNLSVGYDFEPKWYACGQSPLCVEVDRLVKSGVVVVVAAGNTGYGFNQTMFKGPPSAGLDVTINDPGNADLAITVGSTHRDKPHIYGVSYFSSKGPTGDGRAKPDLVAPGERIISCQSSGKAAGAKPNGQRKDAQAAKKATGDALYKEDSGTSMAAPHVSGAIAAFLSIRNEFIGRPEKVKEIFMSTATDLKRTTYFQGKGLIDLMRAIQSV